MVIFPGPLEPPKHPFGWGRRPARAQGLHPGLTVRERPSYGAGRWSGVGRAAARALWQQPVFPVIQAGLKATLSCACGVREAPSGLRVRVRAFSSQSARCLPGRSLTGLWLVDPRRLNPLSWGERSSRRKPEAC